MIKKDNKSIIPLDHRGSISKDAELISDQQTRGLLFNLISKFSTSIPPAEKFRRPSFLKTNQQSLSSSRKMGNFEISQLLNRFELGGLLSNNQDPNSLVVAHLGASDPTTQEELETDDPYKLPLVQNESLNATHSKHMGEFRFDRNLVTSFEPMGAERIVEMPDQLTFYTNLGTLLTNGTMRIKISTIARLNYSPTSNSADGIDPWVMKYFTDSAVNGMPIYIIARFFSGCIDLHPPDDSHQAASIEYRESPNENEYIVDCWGLTTENIDTVPIPHNPQTDFIFYSLNKHIQQNSVSPELLNNIP